MNINSVRGLIIALSAALLVACGGGGGGGNTDIDPADANAVMQALLVKVGDATGTLLENTDIPPASNTSEQPEVVVQRAVTTTTNGATAQVPLSLTSNSPIANLFIKVAGSADVIRVVLSGESTAAALAQQRAAFATQNLSKALSEDMANLEIAIPPNIRAGAFDVEIAVEDEDGLVSLRETGTIQIVRVGTGTLQFSLSWDAFVDLDLEVTDPAGNRIFFEEPTSPTGGRLDRDNTVGGPGSIENIFWETSAPTGTYKVDVNYFAGSEAANFVVTVSINGTVIDTISRANFQANDGRLPVYDLNFGGNAGNSTGVIFPDRAPGDGDNDPSEVLARMQGTWTGCFAFDEGDSERETLVFNGNQATSTFEYFPSNNNCTGTPIETSVDTVTFVVGPAVQTTNGVLANELDITFVTSSEDGINPGDEFFDIIFVSGTQMVFGDADIGGTTPAERPNTLDFSFTLSPVSP